MCISRCGVVATVEDGRLTQVNADPAHPNGCICVIRNDGAEGANANLIIANEGLDPISGAVPHRAQPCRVRKVSV